jgi:ubiquinone/menaquinone biosynthesis C-methylase UbiE
MTNDTPSRAPVTGFFEADSLEVFWRYAYRPEFVPLLLDYLGAQRGMDVLEVGCGTSFLTRLLARTLDDVHVVGVDPDPQMLNVGQRALEREGLVSRVRLVQGDAYALPFPDQAFDLVASQTVL